MNEKTSRAVILIDKLSEKYIVTIKRKKYKENKCVSEYYTLPGGHVDNGETFEEALLRELEEELSIKAKISEKIINMYNEDLKREEEFYYCDVVSGIIKPGNGPEWKNPNVKKYGSYSIEYLNIKNLSKYNLLPVEIKELLIEKYEN